MNDAELEDSENNKNESRGRKIIMLKINIDGFRSHKGPQGGSGSRWKKTRLHLKFENIY